MRDQSSTPACPVVFACDEGYAMPLATTMRSLVESNQPHWPLELYVLAEGFGEESRHAIEASLPPGSARIHWIEVDLAQYAALGTLPHISRATYARLLIASVLPQAVSRVLYLDADVLVLDDLQPVWAVEMQGRPIAAVRDELDELMRRGEPGWEDVPRVRCYFNAGVLLLDLDVWRRDQTGEKAVEYLRAHPDTRMADQDALNVVCDGRWLALPERWNVPCARNSNIGTMSAAERPGIAHFVTRRKPWIARYRSPHAAFYDSFRSRTRFARTLSQQVWDALAALVAGVRNVLRRKGLNLGGDDWAQPVPVRRKSVS